MKRSTVAGTSTAIAATAPFPKPLLLVLSSLATSSMGETGVTMLTIFRLTSSLQIVSRTAMSPSMVKALVPSTISFNSVLTAA